MKKLFGTARKNEDKIRELESLRNRSKSTVRHLQEQMNAAVRKAAESDELDRKICAMDYETLRDQKDAELQHIQDLNRMIRQLQSAEMTRMRRETVDRISEAAKGLDIEELIAGEDYVTVRREMLQEEDERYREARNENNAADLCEKEDDEFSRLVNRAKVNKTLFSADKAAEQHETVLDVFT